MKRCSFSSKTSVPRLSLAVGKSFKAVRTWNELKSLQEKKGRALSLERECEVRPMEATRVNQRRIPCASAVGVRQPKAPQFPNA